MHSQERRGNPQRRPPPVFVDRSLGSVVIPSGLRAASWDVEVMFEIYGEVLAQALPDPPWIREAAERGRIILTKDKRLRYVASNREAVSNAGARVFCLSRGDLIGDTGLNWFLANEGRITRVSGRAGPYIYLVYENSIRRWWPE